MARKRRIQYPGAIYHVMSRGDRREAIYEGPGAVAGDADGSLSTGRLAGPRHCLMRNHCRSDNLTRAVLSTGGRGKSKFLSVSLPSGFAALGRPEADQALLSTLSLRIHFLAE